MEHIRLEVNFLGRQMSLHAFVNKETSFTVDLSFNLKA